MESLKNLLLKTLLNFADDIIVFLLQRASNETLQEYGSDIGIFLTDHGRGVLGDDWENIEQELQDKVDNFLLGVHGGLNYDDGAE